jgi:tetraacyldisaccharide 4'-kinase
MRLFELIYFLGYTVKKSCDLKRQKKLPSKVISVGNITTGGTGKTPLTISLADEALKRGFRPVVLTRGYKGKAKGPCLVTAEMDEKGAGDEALLMAEKLKDVPVIKSSERYKGGMFFLSSETQVEEKVPETQIAGGRSPLFILDDGFQHRRLYRDKDILLVNAQNPFDSRRLLPMGLLREPLEEIKRADIIVITKARNTDVQELKDEIRGFNSQASLFVAGHRPSYIRTLQGQRLPVEELSEKDVYAFCAIAEPDSFIVELKRAGARLSGVKTYRDHYRFKKTDIDHIKGAADRNGAHWIITTEKDIMRLKGIKSQGLPENLVSLGVEFEAEEGFYDEVFKDL